MWTHGRGRRGRNATRLAQDERPRRTDVTGPPLARSGIRLNREKKMESGLRTQEKVRTVMNTVGLSNRPGVDAAVRITCIPRFTGPDAADIRHTTNAGLILNVHLYALAIFVSAVIANHQQCAFKKRLVAAHKPLYRARLVPVLRLHPSFINMIALRRSFYKYFHSFFPRPSARSKNLNSLQDYVVGIFVDASIFRPPTGNVNTTLTRFNAASVACRGSAAHDHLSRLVLACFQFLIM
ncbi:hypothetical protein QZM91_02440 [Burkholderia multivorans]|nr:hypothetical protein [Burkholderia multivorans]